MTPRTVVSIVGLALVVACGSGGGSGPADASGSSQDVPGGPDLPVVKDTPFVPQDVPGQDVSGTDLPKADPGGGGDVVEDPGQHSAACIQASPPDPAGVAYLAHFLSKDVRIYRFDGAKPVEQAPLDTGGFSHDMALDPYNDLLHVVQDIERKVQVYRVFRPSGPGSPLPAPQKQSEIDFGDETPRFVTTDPLRKLLYVVADPPSTGGILEKHHLHVFDVSDPAGPVPVPGGPVEVPVTTTFDVDPLYGVLFLVGLTGDDLNLYDVSVAGVAPTGLGSSLALTGLYPQQNSSAFQARNVTLDPWKGRMYAARAQSALSEVIAFAYDPVPVGVGALCPDPPDTGDLVKVDDFFDVDKPVEERPNLLDAFRVVPDSKTGNAFLVANAWNGSSATSLVLPLDGELKPGAGCGDWEGMGCWYRSWFEGNPGFHQITDGAACLDPTHRVFVGTTYDVYNEEDPGSVVFFRYENDLSMSPWLGDGGTTMAAGSLPVAAACH